MPALDHTHDPLLRSWVGEANGHPDFPIQNLPLGVFRTGVTEAQAGIAIGDRILPLRAMVDTGGATSDARTAAEAAEDGTLNRLLGLGTRYRKALRHAVCALLRDDAKARPELLLRTNECEMLLPVRVGDYTDFYAGIHHAENVGRLFRPESPLLPNYKWVPIGYHGRASSVLLSGEDVRRPSGQRKLPDETAPEFGPSRRLDFELEVGMWVGPGNGLGDPVGIDHAADHIAGYCLLNDWSARDLQSWEYQPLGPFLAKSFHTTVSPWIVTPEALAPFRQAQEPRPAEDPAPLPYLLSSADQEEGALGVELEVWLRTARMRELGLSPQRLSKSHAKHLYWTPAQMLAHHTSNGCNLRPGDLLGTGTISAPEPDGLGSLLEITRGGMEPVALTSGERRLFLEDGDEVILQAHTQREGFVPIGFGECRAIVQPA